MDRSARIAAELLRPMAEVYRLEGPRAAQPAVDGERFPRPGSPSAERPCAAIRNRIPLGSSRSLQVREPRTLNLDSVRSGVLFRVIDHKHSDWGLAQFQLESKFLY